MPIAASSEQESAERKSLYRLLMQAPLPIAVLVGPELRYDAVNDAFREMNPGEPSPLGKTIREVAPLLAGHESLAMLEKAYRTGEAIRVAELAVPVEQEGGRTEAFFSGAAQPFRE
ncbi:MAG: PAS domain-containing protein [Polyangiaceae bacterium]